MEWLTYGSGYLAGMKLGGTPLVEYTRDRLHRETVRSFGGMAGSNAAYKLTSAYTPAGQLQSRHLNRLVFDRDYRWNDNGDLVRISGPRQTREYGYSATGRLKSVRTLGTGPGHRYPVCGRGEKGKRGDGPGRKPAAGPGAAPGQHPHGVAG